jgi:hypothetical protein
MKIIPWLVLLLLCLPLGLESVDLSSPDEYLDVFMKVRGDASGAASVYHWTGKVYSFIPGEKRMELFGFEGFNISRTVQDEIGFQLLTREAAFFTDYRTGEILEQWRNPFTSATIPVVHIWNDPVNQDMSFEPSMLPYVHQIFPSTDLGNSLVFHMEIFPFYTSPLPRKEYPEYSQSDTYQAAEFFQFFVDKDDLDRKLSIPADISWTRISPWMPFMKMGDRAGNLLFVCRGTKLEGGFAALPKHIKDYVMAHKPEFSDAPQTWSEPNQTSWTFFKQLLETGEIK